MTAVAAEARDICQRQAACSRALLHRAAMDIAEDGDRVTPWVVAFQFADPSLCKHEVQDAIGDYIEAVRAQDDLASDADLWWRYYPDLEGPGQQDAARQIADDDVAETMGVLLHGRSH
jgi:hypothetical protein